MKLAVTAAFVLLGLQKVVAANMAVPCVRHELMFVPDTYFYPE